MAQIFKFYLPFIIALLLLLPLYTQKSLSLSLPFTYSPPLKWTFSDNRQPIWRGMLTGKMAGVKKEDKEKFKLLGLNHLFSPSGFHLSVILTPIFLIIKNRGIKTILLALILCFILQLPGQSALKRMAWIKFFQVIIPGEMTAYTILFFDYLYGSFNESPLGYSYSLLFLLIIYQRRTLIWKIISFSLAQILIFYLNQTTFYPLMLILSPIINLFYGILLPFLFFLSIPLTNWQFKLGSILMEINEQVLSYFINLLRMTPAIELNLFFISILFLLIRFPTKTLLLLMLLNCESLNLENDFKRGLMSWQGSCELKLRKYEQGGGMKNFRCPREKRRQRKKTS